MGRREEAFSAKLRELEQEYGLLRRRIQQAQQLEPQQLQQELFRLLAECRDSNLALTQSICQGRSPAVTALAGAQLEYCRRMEELLLKELPEDMRGRNRTEVLDQAEATALYAEYAIDFATQSMRRALAAAMSAILLFREAERQSGGEERM